MIFYIKYPCNVMEKGFLTPLRFVRNNKIDRKEKFWIKMNSYL